MALTLVGVASGTGGDFSNDFTFPITNPSGDVILVWAVNDRDGVTPTDISAITINGTAATLRSSIEQGTDHYRGRVGYLLNPGTGTISIRVQTDGALTTKPFACALAYSGINQTDPFNELQWTGAQGTGTTIQGFVAGDIGDLGIMFGGYNNVGPTFTPVAGSTLQVDQTFAGIGRIGVVDRTLTDIGHTIGFTSSSSINYIGYRALLHPAPPDASGRAYSNFAGRTAPPWF